MLRPGELMCGDGPHADIHSFVNPLVNGERKCHGLRPRDYDRYPVGFYANIPPLAVDMPLIPQGEWSQRCKDQIAASARLSDVRLTGNNGQPIPSRDQDGKGYCWAHSGVSAHLIARAVMGEPYEDLSAYSIACQVKNFADEGGFGAEGIDFQVQNGCATSATWPQQSMSRSNVNAAMKAEALRFKPTGQWADLNIGQYDRNLTFAQLATLLLSGVPVVVDYNWWSHSVCAIDLVDGATGFGSQRSSVSGKKLARAEYDVLWGMNDSVTGGFGVRILNSWGDSWSEKGTGTLAASKASPDGAVGLKSVTLSP